MGLGAFLVNNQIGNVSDLIILKKGTKLVANHDAFPYFGFVKL